MNSPSHKKFADFAVNIYGWVVSFWNGSALALISAFALLGVVMMVFVPPFQVPDESGHWMGGYARTHSKVSPSNTSQHCSFANALPNLFEVGRIAFYPDQKIQATQFDGVERVKEECSSYRLNYGYVGTYPGLLGARLLISNEDKDPRATFKVFMLSRLLQGAVLLFLAIRLWRLSQKSGMPIPGLLTTLALMVSPVVLQQSFSVSSDLITYALSLSLITFLFFARQARWFDLAILGYLCLSVAVTKPPLFAYIPLFLGTGLLLKRGEDYQTGGRLRLVSWIYMVLLVSLGGAIWMVVQDRPLPEQLNSRNINVGRQLQYVLSNPAQSLSVLLAALDRFLYLDTMLWPLGWLDTAISRGVRVTWRDIYWSAVVADVALAAVMVAASFGRKIERREVLTRLAGGAVLLLGLYVSSILVVLTMYLSWTDVGGTSVEGLQARYFMPMILACPLVVGLILTPSRVRQVEGDNKALSSCAGIVLFGAMSALMLVPLYLMLIKRWW